MSDEARARGVVQAAQRAGEGTQATAIRDTPGGMRFQRQDGRDLLRIDVAPTQQTVLYVRGAQGTARTDRDVKLRRKLAGLGVTAEWRALQARWSWDAALEKARYFVGLDPRVRCGLVLVRTVPIDGLLVLPDELVAMTAPRDAARPEYRNPHVLRPDDDDDYYGVNR
jgi:hypothetical protein